MPALTAFRFNPALRTFHHRLVAAGKKPKVAIVAVMGKNGFIKGVRVGVEGRVMPLRDRFRRLGSMVRRVWLDGAQVSYALFKAFHRDGAASNYSSIEGPLSTRRSIAVMLSF